MEHLQLFKQVLDEEAKAIQSAIQRLDEKTLSQLAEVFSYLNTVGGELVFSGVGKSGIIAQKLASTFSSLGQAAYFLHPIEALHGDLGRLRKESAIVFLSKSGTTEELIKLFPYLKQDERMLIALVGEPRSPIAEKCSIVLDCSVEKEACINNLAPTTSSTVTLAMGDAMAVLYEKVVGVSKEGFAVHHPGGLLGKALSLKVKDLMIPYKECPCVKLESNLRDVILEMTKKNVGLCAVLDSERRLYGIMVEGDIRRAFVDNHNSLETPVKELMTAQPILIGPHDLAMTALKLMEDRPTQLTQVPVVDEGIFLGVIRVHDLLKEGFPKSK